MTYKIDEIGTVFENYTKKLIPKVEKAQKDVAEQLCKEIKIRAPINTGRYVSSIKVGDVQHEGDKLSIAVYTDLLVGGDNPKWANVPLGAFLEWGTGIKGSQTGKATQYGYSYRMTPWAYFSKELGHWVTSKGMIAIPHFSTGLAFIKPKYMEMLKEALKNG